MIQFILQRLHRFHHQNRAAALTEFVIAIPVFLILFSGLFKLYQVGDVAVKNKVYAASKLWENVYAAENDTSRLTPRSSLFNNRQTTNLLGGNVGDAYISLKGHWGEANSRTRVMPVLTGVNIQDSYLRQKRTDRPHLIIGDATVTKGLVDDTLDFDDLRSALGNLSGITNPGQAITRALIGGVLQVVGATSGYAANIRYGNVRIHQTDSRNVAGRNFDFSVSYQAGVSPALKPPFWDPFSDPEKRAWVTGRLIGEMENPYAGLMNVVDGNNLDRYRRYVVPNY